MNTRYAMLMATLCGCGAEEKAIETVRAVSDSVVGASPDLQPFFGTWIYDGEDVVSIVRRADGSAVLQTPIADGWDVVVNNVRLDGRSLIYDVYCYFAPERSSNPEARRLRHHPFSGTKCEMELNPGEHSDELISYGGALRVSGRSMKLTRKKP